MSKILTTAATIIVLGLAATGAADARGGGGGGFGGGHGGFGGGFGGGHIGGFGGAHLGGIGAGAAHMGGIGAGRLGAMGGTIRGHDRGTRDFARHDRRYDPDWGYAASCVIYEPYHRPRCAGDVDSGILSPGGVY